MSRLRRYMEELTLVERLSILYLALPVAIFYVGWLQPMLGLICLILLGIVVLPPLGRTLPAFPPGNIIRVSAAILTFAIFWCCLGGAGHLFYANKDWIVRDAVLRDLVVFPWPVNYSATAGQLILMRAPLGYYLVPASLSRWLGLDWADSLQLLWTILGVALFFLQITARLQKPWHRIVTVVIFMAFSGLDIVGSLIMGDPVVPTAHLEWWARYFQYSSMTTLLFWVPNHGIAGWLVAGLFLDHWRDPRFLPLTLILTSLLPLWSPLTAIGAALLGGAIYLFHLRLGHWRAILVPETAIACLLAIPVASYLTLRAARIPSGWFFSRLHDLRIAFIVYALFIFLELAIVPILLRQEWKLKTEHFYISAAAGFFLLLLPLYYFGESNDLVMRVSIPLLAVIAVRTAAIFIAAVERHDTGQVVVMAFILVLGAVTPLYEVGRSALQRAWKPDLTQNLMVAANINSPNYIARLETAKLPFFLKKPPLDSADSMR